MCTTCGSRCGCAGCCSSIREVVWSDGSNRNTQAFYFNQLGRAVLFISFTFLSLAILQLANKMAGCPQNEDGGYVDCGNRVYGAKPSSMLALMAVASGVATAAFMPFAGAVVDYSDYRRGFGIICATLLVAVNVAQIFIFESTWFAFAILQGVVAGSTFMGNSMVMYSYIHAENEHKLHGIMASSRIWETSGMLGFLVIVAGVAMAFRFDSVETSRLSQTLASVVGGIFLYLSYSRYKPVQRQREVTEGKSLFLTGMISLWSTIRGLGKTAPGAQRFLISILFTEGSTGSFTSLAITCKFSPIHQLNFSFPYRKSHNPSLSSVVTFLCYRLKAGVGNV